MKTWLSQPSRIVHGGIIAITIAVVGVNVTDYRQAKAQLGAVFTEPEAIEAPVVEPTPEPEQRKESIALGVLKRKYQEQDYITVTAEDTPSYTIKKQEQTLATAANQVAIGSATSETAKTDKEVDVSPFANIEVEETTVVDTASVEPTPETEQPTEAPQETTPEQADTEPEATDTQDTPQNTDTTPGAAQIIEQAQAASDVVPVSTIIEPALTKDKPVASVFAAGAAVAKSSSIKPVEATASALFVYHEIKPGETLSTIAAKYGLKTKTLEMESGLREDQLNTIKTGTTISILPADGATHRVNSGDTLAEIAKAYGGSVETIQKDNDIIGDELEEGQILFIRDGEKEIPKKPVVVQPTTQYASNSAATRSSTPTYSAPTTPRTYSSGGATVISRRPVGPIAGMAAGYCTSWGAYKFPVNWRGNAIQWPAAARAKGFRVNNTPQAGSLVITNENGYYGHVAYIESINGDGSLNVTEQNYVGWGVVSARTIPANYGRIVAYIHR